MALDGAMRDELAARGVKLPAAPGAAKGGEGGGDGGGDGVSLSHFARLDT